MSVFHRLKFAWRYLTGNAPWDTNITPPEVVQLVEGEQLPPGRALDLGCGTGTNAVYLARHGWRVTGVDFIARAVRAARRRARHAGVTGLVRFIRSDVTRLDTLNLPGPFDLALDIGCSHGLPVGDLPGYASSLARYVRPGGTYLTYMFRPTAERPLGLEPDAVEQLFAPHFDLVWSSVGEDVAAGARSAWYRFERNGNS